MQIEQQPYKGVRDFYPATCRLQTYIFSKWSEVVESYGYEKYDASVLEYLNLYYLKNQTNTEIINDQIYSFVDRGQRQVALRPEMTPTVARMVAARRQELTYPLRWYSIPNLWRYERPQKGRLREHWQLNVDCFGLEGSEAELELILMADDILKSFKASSGMYKIHISSRAFIEDIFKQYLNLSRVQSDSLIMLFDRYDKMGQVAFEEACQQLFAPNDKIREKDFGKLKALLNCSEINKLPALVQALPSCETLKQLFQNLEHANIVNVVLDLKIVRGFDYYTGVVFEIFDSAAGNQRSMFGGGRYDNLLASFGVKPLTGVGFGMGDVTMINFLQSHQLLPSFKNTIDLYVVLFEDATYAEIVPLLKALRAEKLQPVVDSRPIKPAKKIETALKRKIDHVLFVGAADLKEELFNLRHLPSSQESKLSLTRIISKLAGVNR